MAGIVPSLFPEGRGLFYFVSRITKGGDMARVMARGIFLFAVLAIPLALSGCGPSLLAGEANVIRAVERRDLEGLGKIALTNAAADLRIAAIKGFQNFPNTPQVVTYLSEVISRTYNPTIKRAAVHALLYQLEVDAARRLVTDYLVSGTVNTKLSLLGNIHKARFLDAETKKQFMKISLNDPNPDVRLSAASGLRKLSDLSGSEVVHELVMSSFLPIKRRAAEEIGFHMRREFVPTISYLASNEADAVVKSYAQLALSKVDGAPGSVQAAPPAARQAQTVFLDNQTRAKNRVDDLLKNLRKFPPARVDKGKYLVAIGIEDYADVPDVDYARNSTNLLVEVMQRRLGVPSGNTLVLLNENATGTRIKGKVKTFLANIGEDATLYLYFAGHGVPSQAGNRVYLLPQDAAMESYEDEYFNVDNFLNAFLTARPKHVYAFLDSCFSGRVNADTLLFKGVASITLTLKEEFRQLDRERFTIFTAAEEDQFANSLEEKGHRLFSYYLAKGLIDGKFAVGDLKGYLASEVASQSRKKGKVYSQDIKMFGDQAGDIMRN